MDTLGFVIGLWKANLLAALEYRVAFLMQVVGMFVNNAAFFVFWVIYFHRFGSVRGWHFADVLLMYSELACGFGALVVLFGNVFRLSTVIAEGELDFYLGLPRPVLLHVLASRAQISGLGDFMFGLAGLGVVGVVAPGQVGRFLLAAALGGAVLGGVMVAAHSLTFWTGNSTAFANTMLSGFVILGAYPLDVFGGWSRVLIFTLLPAAFVGAVPAQLVTSFSWATLGWLGLAAGLSVGAGLLAFHGGLARYEGGSAIALRA